MGLIRARVQHIHQMRVFDRCLMRTKTPQASRRCVVGKHSKYARREVVCCPKLVAPIDVACTLTNHTSKQTTPTLSLVAIQSNENKVALNAHIIKARNSSNKTQITSLNSAGQNRRRYVPRSTLQMLDGHDKKQTFRRGKESSAGALGPQCSMVHDSLPVPKTHEIELQHALHS